ncbi:hypothetical protein WJX84_012203 [Apatococcus fuscideae]|uniref:Kinesin-like protein n=1 Tax=Apatococcus fuscideae TaxID=2026836 RepID=A0AAW1TD42_9CHLO
MSVLETGGRGFLNGRLTEDQPGEASTSEADCKVCVAVHVRPLIDTEAVEGCQSTLQVTAGQPQISCGQSYTYDHVFGGGGTHPDLLYDRCVMPLVHGLFRGYNATVFAYGQTGSGKTYTMGSAFNAGGPARGVIPKVMEAIFARISSNKDTGFTVRVGFVEIHREDIRDLLVLDPRAQSAVHIREVAGGGVCLAGATEKEVGSQAEMADVLAQGSLLRATGSTGMNKHSSRSHAIFTITLEQRREIPGVAAGAESGSDDEEAMGAGETEYLCAKMHLVDLAGSERVKRTKAEGTRLKEGIDINKGLLALGNVINALAEGKAHVPYRDSRLTRMLQDSLGGNSRTVMIACVSPADINLDETANTLRYAARARNISNKPVVNRDPVVAQIAHLRQMLAAARSENQTLKHKLGGDVAQLEGSRGTWDSAGIPSGDDILAEQFEELQRRHSKTELDNASLRLQLVSV